MSKVWWAFQYHSQSVIFVFAKWCYYRTQIFALIVQFKSVILHGYLQSRNKFITFTFTKISCITRSGYCFLLITLFKAQKSMIQQTRPSFFAWIKLGLAHSLAPWKSKTPISTRWSSSFLNVYFCRCVTGYALACTGWYPCSISTWNFLCG